MKVLRQLPCATVLVLTSVLLAVPAFAGEGDKIRVLIIDGQHNHAWRDTTAFLKEVLERNGRFAVDVSSNLKPNDKPGKVPTVPFPPDLTKYQVAISNYNGPAWPADFRKTFEERVKDGKLGLSQRNRNVPILVALEMSATISLFLLLEPFSPWVIRGWGVGVTLVGRAPVQVRVQNASH